MPFPAVHLHSSEDIFRFLNEHILSCGQSYKHFKLVNYDSWVVIWGIIKSGTTLKSFFYKRKFFIRLATEIIEIVVYI